MENSFLSNLLTSYATSEELTPVLINLLGLLINHNLSSHMPLNTFWLILAGAGALQTVFLSVYILFSGRIPKEERILLSLLLLVISLRIIKSIGWYYFDITADLFLNAGFLAHAFIGPILILYFIKKSNAEVGYIIKGLVLLPPFLLAVLSPFLTLKNFWYVSGYNTLLYGTNIYLLISSYFLWRIYQQKKIYFPWYRNLYFVIAIFCLSYFTNFAFGTNPYITGPIIYSIAAYIISFILFSNPDIFTPVGDKRKYKNINLSSEQIANHRDKIERTISEEKPYLNSGFSLTELSDLTSIPKHLLSRYFSENLNQSFTDFTNGYRIERAKELLSNPSYSNHKIAFIAYECGFNSLSSFNAAFRKKVEMSPSEFKKQVLI